MASIQQTVFRYFNDNISRVDDTDTPSAIYQWLEERGYTQPHTSDRWKALAEDIGYDYVGDIDIQNKIATGELTPPFTVAPLTIGDWTAGTNTTLSLTESRARATASGGNPFFWMSIRISREVSNLQSGETYRVVSNIYQETASGDTFFRVSSTQNLTTGDIVNNRASGDRAINETFVAPSDTVFIGIVAVALSGQFAETDLNFEIEVVNA